MKKYFLNPEFHRNLWIEFTPLRLLAMPVMLGLGCFAFTRMQSDPYMALCSVSMVAFFVIVVLWGCYTAASTLQDEVRNNVWDFQRTSSIAPAKYAFGKLFGSTSYVWYFGIAVWLIFAFAFLNLSKPPLPDGLRMPGGLKVEDIEISPAERLRDFTYVSFFIFLAGFTGQVTSFLLGCQSLAGTSRMKKLSRWRANLGAFFVGAVAASTVYALLVSPFFNTIVYQKASSYGEYLKGTTRFWYGHELSGLWISIISVLFILLWELVAIWRVMKRELLCKILPVAWPLFMLTFLVYVGGFADTLDKGLKVTLALSLVMTYCVMFGDALEVPKYRRLAEALRLKKTAAVFENTPTWALSVVFPLVLMPALLIAISDQETPARVLTTATGYLSLMFFMLRDGLAVHAIFWGTRYRHARFALIAYYATIYVLLPLAVSHNYERYDFDFLMDSTKTSGKDYLNAFFSPTALDEWWISIVIPLAQSAMAGVALWWVIRKQEWQRP